MSDYSTAEPPPAVGPPEPPPEPTPPRRRALWITLVAAAVVLVLGIPLVLYLALRGGSGQPSANPTAGPSPSVATSLPSAVPSAASTTRQPVAAPDGRITYDQLKNATLVIPQWPADNLTGPSGRLTFTNGDVTWTSPGPLPVTVHVVIGSRLVYGDVDRDGAQETVAAIGCYTQGGSQQLVAFDRDSAGRIVTLGTVVATTGPVRSIGDEFTVGGDGVVTAKVFDYQGCCGDETPTLSQDRRYGWSGHEFRQVGGPTSFPVNPHVTETGMTASDLVFGPLSNGVRHATMTVTVAYLWGVAPDHLTISFTLPADVQREGSWPPVHPTRDGGPGVDVPAPALGTTHTYTFGFSRTAVDSNDEYGNAWVHVVAIDEQGNTLGNANAGNDLQHPTIRNAG